MSILLLAAGIAASFMIGFFVVSRLGFFIDDSLMGHHKKKRLGKDERPEKRFRERIEK